MPNRATAAIAGVILVLLALVAYFAFGNDADTAPATALPGPQGDAAAALAQGDLARPASSGAVATEGPAREQVQAGGPPTGVRGIVLDAKTGQPLGGVEVVAVKDEPSIEPLVARFRGLIQGGMFTETRSERRELGRTTSNADGTFELLGLGAGRVFLDGRSDGWFVRTPGTARLATGQIQEGVELRASPGGRVRGVVLGADGGPVAGAAVSVRPGLNAFLGQLTDRQYRWLETTTDAMGRFDLPGVPSGQGYTVAASAASIALEEAHGVDVRWRRSPR